MQRSTPCYSYMYSYLYMQGSRKNVCGLVWACSAGETVLQGYHTAGYPMNSKHLAMYILALGRCEGQLPDSHTHCTEDLQRNLWGATRPCHHAFKLLVGGWVRGWVGGLVGWRWFKCQ